MTDRILILQTAFAGDVILTLPLIDIIKKKYPDAYIDFLCIPSVYNLLENNPDINNIIVYDKKGKEKGISGLLILINILRKTKYNIVISPHRSARSAIISFFTGSNRRISFDKSALKLFYTDVVEYKNNVHEIVRNYELLKPLGINQNEILMPALYPDGADKEKVSALINNISGIYQNKFITVSPGSVWFTKRFPEEKFIKLINYLISKNASVVLTGGENDTELCNRIGKKINNGLLNTSGKLTFLQTAELIKRASVHITNDSAPLHIANSVGTPVIAIFGSTIPEFGFYPYGEKDVIFQTENLSCRPCGIHGRQECPIKTFVCMNRIDEKAIAEKALEFLSG